MSEALNRQFALPDKLVADIAGVLHKRFGLKLTDTRELASAIQKMSDYYIENPRDATPWNERWCQIAQLAYYFPLNYLRSQAVLLEGKRFGYFGAIESLVDFGAGLGPTSRAFSETIQKKVTTTVVEKSGDALALARDLGSEFVTAVKPVSRPGSLLTCSYSLTELTDPPPWLFDFENILVIEPSTRDDGRALLAARKRMITEGFSIWAPCPHQGPCPLFEKNPHDWCHDRIHFERPDWWLQMEKLLPFQNPTLTFSYLLASKRPRPSTSPHVRLVGDLLKEKGKSRQMICRGPEREFFSWLKRYGEAPELRRGTLLEQPENYETTSNELRLREPPKIVPID